MKKIILILSLLLFANFSYSQLSLARIQQIMGTGQLPKGANNIAVWNTLYYRADSAASHNQYFSNGGNSFGGSTLGSIDNTHLSFITNNVIRQNISSDGDITMGHNTDAFGSYMKVFIDSVRTGVHGFYNYSHYTTDTLGSFKKSGNNRCYQSMNDYNYLKSGLYDPQEERTFVSFDKHASNTLLTSSLENTRSIRDSANNYANLFGFDATSFQCQAVTPTTNISFLIHSVNEKNVLIVDHGFSDGSKETRYEQDSAHVKITSSDSISLLSPKLKMTKPPTDSTGLSTGSIWMDGSTGLHWKYFIQSLTDGYEYGQLERKEY